MSFEYQLGAEFMEMMKHRDREVDLAKSIGDMLAQMVSKKSVAVAALVEQQSDLSVSLGMLDSDYDLSGLSEEVVTVKEPRQAEEFEYPGYTVRGRAKEKLMRERLGGKLGCGCVSGVGADGMPRGPEVGSVDVSAKFSRCFSRFFVDSGRALVKHGCQPTAGQVVTAVCDGEDVDYQSVERMKCVYVGDVYHVMETEAGADVFSLGTERCSDFGGLYVDEKKVVERGYCYLAMFNERFRFVASLWLGKDPFLERVLSMPVTWFVPPDVLCGLRWEEKDGLLHMQAGGRGDMVALLGDCVRVGVGPAWLRMMVGNPEKFASLGCVHYRVGGNEVVGETTSFVSYNVLFHHEALVDVQGALGLRPGLSGVFAFPVRFYVDDLLSIRFQVVAGQVRFFRGDGGLPSFVLMRALLDELSDLKTYPVLGLVKSQKVTLASLGVAQPYVVGAAVMPAAGSGAVDLGPKRTTYERIVCGWRKVGEEFQLSLKEWVDGQYVSLGVEAVVDSNSELRSFSRGGNRRGEMWSLLYYFNSGNGNEALISKLVLEKDGPRNRSRVAFLEYGSLAP